VGVLLEMKSITKRFDKVLALKDVSLIVDEGKTHAIVGENGAGKSTLMKILSGVYPHGDYEGRIFYKDEECAFKNIKDSEKRGSNYSSRARAYSISFDCGEYIFGQRTGQKFHYKLACNAPENRRTIE